MSKSNVVEPEDREGIADPLTELLREGCAATDPAGGGSGIGGTAGAAWRSSYRGRYGLDRAQRFLPERELQTGVGPVTVRIPKVRAKTGEPVTFRSALVPPYVRKTQSLEAALPCSI